MYITFSPNTDVTYLGIELNIIVVVNHKSESYNIYWDCNGNIFHFLKCSLQYSISNPHSDSKRFFF